MTNRSPTRRGWLLASPILLIAFIPLFANWKAASRRGDTTTRAFAHDLLNSVEPYAVIVTAGGAINGHPSGAEVGAREMMDALAAAAREAAAAGIPRPVPA